MYKENECNRSRNSIFQYSKNLFDRVYPQFVQISQPRRPISLFIFLFFPSCM